MNFFAAKIFEYQLKLNSRSNKLELPFNFSYYIKFVLLEIQYLDCTNSSLTYLHTNNLKRMIMENLIKIQAIINQIEEISFENVEYRSKFLYTDETSMTIESYCKEWTIAIMQIISNIKGCSAYFEDNHKIKVIDYIERIRK